MPSSTTKAPSIDLAHTCGALWHPTTHVIEKKTPPPQATSSFSTYIYARDIAPLWELEQFHARVDFSESRSSVPAVSSSSSYSILSYIQRDYTCLVDKSPAGDNIIDRSAARATCLLLLTRRASIWSREIY